MTRTAFFLLGLIMIAPLYWPQQSNAADEDTAASVYLVFDAETGEFITVDDEGGKARVHQETQESIAAGSPAENSGGADVTNSSVGNSMNVPLVGGIFGVLIVAGFIAWRRGQKKRGQLP